MKVSKSYILEQLRFTVYPSQSLEDSEVPEILRGSNSRLAGAAMITPVYVDAEDCLRECKEQLRVLERELDELPDVLDL